MCESVPLKAPQRRRSDSAAAVDPARPRRSEALSKNPPKRAGRSNENKHIGRTEERMERLHFLLCADRNWVRMRSGRVS